jgi:hypothetical protein
MDGIVQGELVEKEDWYNSGTQRGRGRDRRRELGGEPEEHGVQGQGGDCVRRTAIVGYEDPKGPPL